MRHQVRSTEKNLLELIGNMDRCLPNIYRQPFLKSDIELFEVAVVFLEQNYRAFHLLPMQIQLFLVCISNIRKFRADNMSLAIQDYMLWQFA